VPAALLVALYAWSRRPVVLIAGAAWLLYVPYEYGMKLLVVQIETDGRVVAADDVRVPSGVGAEPGDQPKVFIAMRKAGGGSHVDNSLDELGPEPGRGSLVAALELESRHPRTALS